LKSSKSERYWNHKYRAESAPALSTTTVARDAPRLRTGQTIPWEETVSIDDEDLAQLQVAL
jgi:hypothetical protein